MNRCKNGSWLIYDIEVNLNGVWISKNDKLMAMLPPSVRFKNGNINALNEHRWFVEFGQFGKCYIETGVFGVFDYDDALKVIKSYHEYLSNYDFRIVRYELSVDCEVVYETCS